MIARPPATSARYQESGAMRVGTKLPSLISSKGGTKPSSETRPSAMNGASTTGTAVISKLSTSCKPATRLSDAPRLRSQATSSARCSATIADVITR